MTSSTHPEWRHPNIPLTGVVLAGGRSSRMGRDKAFMPGPDGRTLLERQLSLLREVPMDAVLISGRSGASYPELGADVVVDEHPDLGPMGGLHTTLAGCRDGLLVAVAVDLPKLGVGTIRRLLEASGPNCGAVPKSEAGYEPLCAVYPSNDYTRTQFSRAIKEGRLSLQTLLAGAEREGWMRSVQAPPEEFTNWNSPDDVR